MIGSILQKLEGDELNRFERLRNVDKEEQEEEMHNPMEDLERVADEKYDGITGKMFKHHAKRLRAMSVKENEKKGEGMV